jgi:GR25 family glycosyltransferase involved in LPS biosynthesis
MKIKKGYYINLDYRIDRRKLIETQLKIVGFESIVERFSAVDGNSLYGKSVKCLPHTKEWYSVARSALTSHKNVIEKAKDENLDNVMILEDDCLFYDRKYTAEYIKSHNFINYQVDLEVNSLDVINKALDQIDQFPDWEILFLGCTILPLEKNIPIKLVSPNLAEIKSAISCHAYIVNKNAYDRLILWADKELKQEKFSAMMDVIWNNLTKKYAVYPIAVVQQQTGITDIGGESGVGPLYWDHNFDREVIKLY